MNDITCTKCGCFILGHVRRMCDACSFPEQKHPPGPSLTGNPNRVHHDQLISDGGTATTLLRDHPLMKPQMNEVDPAAWAKAARVAGAIPVEPTDKAADLLDEAKRIAAVEYHFGTNEFRIVGRPSVARAQAVLALWLEGQK